MSYFGGNLLPAAVSEPDLAICLNSLSLCPASFLPFRQDTRLELKYTNRKQY